MSRGVQRRFVALTLIFVSSIGCSRAQERRERDSGSDEPSNETTVDLLLSQPASDAAAMMNDAGAKPTRPPAPASSEAPVISSSAKVWSTKLAHGLTALHVTRRGDILAISEQRVAKYNSRGRLRWYRNLAPGDRVIPSDRCIYVRTADHKLLMGLDDRGGVRWERPVEGTLASLDDGTLLAADAAAVRSIECRRGRELWMFSPDRQRSLKLLSVHDDGLLLLGELGTRRFLFSLSLDGELRARRELPRSTQAAQVAASGWILARTPLRLIALDEQGAPLWTSPVTARTEIARYRRKIVLADGSPDGEIEVRVLDRNGEAERTYRFDGGEEPVSMHVLAADEGPLLVAACTGALRSCAERGLSAGPYNRLWGCGEDGQVTSLVGSREESYFNLAQRGTNTVIAATASDNRITTVVRIDGTLQAATLARLRGRRMLGPVAGPNDTWLVATCQGHRCQQPWRLHAIAGQIER